jgi:hypothetical protein
VSLTKVLPQEAPPIVHLAERAGEGTRTLDIQLGKNVRKTQIPVKSELPLSIFSKNSIALQGFCPEFCPAIIAKATEKTPAARSITGDVAVIAVPPTEHDSIGTLAPHRDKAAPVGELSAE